MKILLIEDEPEISQMLCEMLVLNGHTVLAAADGEAGVRLAAERPELVLCDIGLPGKSGYEVIQEIQQLPGGGEVPFIFLTALADRANQRRGMALGADDYITKPFTEREILDAISARVGRQRRLRARIEELIERHRREVSADWSQELMAPLTGVLGGLQLIESDKGSISPAELRELLGLIKAGAERQQRLSGKLIRYFELERWRDTPRVPGAWRCHAGTAVAAAAARAGDVAQRSADLRVACEPGEVALPEEYLIDAVAELAGNALRYSAPGQPVGVNGRVTGPSYRIEVSDSGPGMSPAERERAGAFTQFPRAARERQGLGLGLAIARLTASLGGGGITLTDGAGGTGLRALMELPLAEPAA